MSHSDSLRFSNPDEHYRQFNLQRPEQVQRLTQALAGQSPRFDGVIELSGPPKVGKRYLLDAAAYLAQELGAQVQVVALDPDYQPGETQLETYLARLSNRQDQAGRERLEALQQMASVIWDQQLSKLNETLALVVNLLLALRQPLGQLLDLGKQAGGLDLYRPDDERLARLLRAWAGDGQLCLLLPMGTELHLVGELLRIKRLEPKLLLAFMEDHEAPDAAYLEYEPLRLALQPYDQPTLRRLIAERFPGQLPDAFADSLHAASRGEPGLLAGYLRELHAIDIPYRDEQDIWRLPPEGLEHPELVKVLQRQLYQPLADLLDELHENGQTEQAKQLLQFLRLAALCAPRVPIEPIAEAMQLDAHQADWLFDQLDDRLGADGANPLFRDLGIHHEGFPDLELREFANPILPAVLLSPWSEPRRESEAIALYRHLNTRLPARTRPIAGLHLQLLRHVGDEPRLAHQAAELGWWIALAGVEALRRTLTAGIEQGRVAPEALWHTVWAQWQRWPAARRLALLEAYGAQTDGVPSGRMAEWLSRQGDCNYELGHYPQARALYEQALSLLDPHRPEEQRDLAAVYSNLGGVIQHQGELELARDHQQRALTINERILSPHDPDLATSHNNLAALYSQMGEAQRAKRHLEQALEIFKLALPGDHPDLARAHNNLGSVLTDLGEWQQAREHLERSLAIWSKALPGHPNLANSHNELGRLFDRMGETDQAETHFSVALRIWQASLPPDHPLIATALANLAWIARAKGDLGLACERLRQALAIQRQSIGDEHPDTRRTQEWLADWGCEGDGPTTSAPTGFQWGTPAAEVTVELSVEPRPRPGGDDKQ